MNSKGAAQSIKNNHNDDLVSKVSKPEKADKMSTESLLNGSDDVTFINNEFELAFKCLTELETKSEGLKELLIEKFAKIKSEIETQFILDQSLIESLRQKS